MRQNSLVETLKACIELTDNKDLNLAIFKDDLENLLTRFQEGRFHLAVLGQFKRGKSTIVNALIGDNLLPTAVVPLTAIPTFINYSDKLNVKVCFLDRSKQPVEFKGDKSELGNFLDKFVTETGNPKNKLQVSHVEVFYPSPLLQKGFVLIDTPGIGSTYKHNTEMTINFLSQCDAAIFVTSTDPPITEVELDFLKSVKSEIPRIFFVLNKIDYLDEDELQTSLDFLINILRKNLEFSSVDVNPVSAKKALKGKLNKDNRLIKDSKIDNLEQKIIQFMENEKLAALKIAISRKAKDIIENILMQIRLLIKSYTTPVEELEEKIKILEKKIEDAKQEKLIVGDILKGDIKRLEEYLDKETDELCNKSIKFFKDKLFHVIENSTIDSVKDNVQEFLNKNIPPYFEKEFGIFSREFSKKASELLCSHEKRAMKVIESIRKNAMELMNIPYIPLQGEKGLKMRVKPYWVVNRWETTLIAISNKVVDTIVPGNLLKKRYKKRYEEQLKILINSNVENLRWSIFQGIQDTFREFMFDFDKQMEEVIFATKGAVEKGIEKKKSETGKLAKEVEKLENIVKTLEQLKKNVS
jgi:small GTP-binding protein